MRKSSSRRRSTTTRKSSVASKQVKRASCVACNMSTLKHDKNALLTTTQTFPAPWLEELNRTAIPRHSARFQQLEANGFQADAPDVSDICVSYTGMHLPAKVVYWASNPGTLHNAHLLQSAECAYGKYTNMGVAVRKNNTLHMVLRTPRPYMAKQRGKRNGQLWCRHLHFVEVDPKTNTVPSTNQNVLFTLGIFPCTLLEEHKKVYRCESIIRPSLSQTLCYTSMFVSFEQYLLGKHAHAVGINAIDNDDYPPICNNDLVISSKTTSDAIRKTLHASTIMQKHGIHTPIIVYCAHENCCAAQTLIEKLYTLGYCNVFYLHHGMKEAMDKSIGMLPFLQKSKIHLD